MITLNGVLSAGTVRSLRKHLPKDDVPSDEEMERGEVACYESNGIYYVKWKDNKGVHMLSNHLSAYPLQKVQRRKKGSEDKDDVPCANVIKLYTYHMGGVDLMYQKKGTYRFDHRLKIKYYLPEVESRIQGSRPWPRPRTQKKSGAKDNFSEDRPS